MRRLKTREIALAAMLAVLYAVLVLAFSPISFLILQIRVADALAGLVPILGPPAIIGLTFGVLVANVFSPLGPIDLASSIFELISLYIVWKLRRVSVFVGLAICSVIIGAWVSFMISYVFGTPYLLTFAYVTSGVFVANAILGYLLYRVMDKVIPKWWRG